MRPGSDFVAGLETGQVAGNGTTRKAADGPGGEPSGGVIVVRRDDSAGGCSAGGLSGPVPGESPGVTQPVGDGGEAPVGVVGAGDAGRGRSPRPTKDDVGDEAARVAGVGCHEGDAGDGGGRGGQPIHDVVAERERRR